MDFLKGRINRTVYWFGLCLIAVLMTAVWLFLHSSAGVNEAILVFLCIPRLHDIGRSGWLVLWGIGAEITVIVLGVILLPLDDFPLAASAGTVIVAGLLIWLGSIKGDRLANRFGEPPQAGAGLMKKPTA